MSLTYTGKTSSKRNVVILAIVSVTAVLVVVSCFRPQPQSHQAAPIVDGRAKQSPSPKAQVHRAHKLPRIERATQNAFSKGTGPCGSGLMEQRRSDVMRSPSSSDKQESNRAPRVPASPSGQSRIIISIFAGSTVAPSGAASVQISMEPTQTVARYSNTAN